MTEAVGFVGLGMIGAPMAARLADAGFAVHGYDADPARAEAAGVAAAATAREAADRSDGTVVVVVRTLAQVEAVAAEIVRPGLTLVVSSTVGPAVLARLAEELAAKGAAVVDAAVSGGPPRARAGTLTLLAAGAADAVERVRPLLDALASNVHVLGETPGAGQAMKLVNQLFLFANLHGVREGLRLAEAFGLDRKQVRDVMTTASGNSYVLHEDLDLYGQPQSLEVVEKDLHAILAAADAKAIDLPLSMYLLGDIERTLGAS